jgi:hypothetical protein
MSKTYELWDAATRNLVAAHASEADALAFVRTYADQHGPEYPKSWVLLWDDEDADEAVEVAEGSSLLALAGVSTDPGASAPSVGRRAG